MTSLKLGPVWKNSTFALILPLGFSFFIFSGLSYLFDIKRKKIQAERNILDLSLYFLFFPKISQGPIERAGQIFPNLKQGQLFSFSNATAGSTLILWGFFKKIVIADRLAVIVNTLYDQPANYNGISLAIATVFFAIQIYADFSGYTDIAIGSAQLLGIPLSRNFNRPYFAATISEFWKRWHMTFTSWLRDYLYLPLAYFISGKLRKDSYLRIKTDNWIYFTATIVTFFICGIWHGVGWTFLVWGLLHGIYLVLGNWIKRIRKKNHIRITNSVLKKVSFITGMIGTFILVDFAWIFFRADSIKDAFVIINKIAGAFKEITNLHFTEGYLSSTFSGLGVTKNEFIFSLVIVTLYFIIESIQKSWEIPQLISRFPRTLRWTFYYLIGFMILFFGAFNSTQDFIYAQF